MSETRQSPCPSPLINIPSDSSQVLDADEEVRLQTWDKAKRSDADRRLVHELGGLAV